MNRSVGALLSGLALLLPFVVDLNLAKATDFKGRLSFSCAGPYPLSGQISLAPQPPLYGQFVPLGTEYFGSRAFGQLRGASGGLIVFAYVAKSVNHPGLNHICLAWAAADNGSMPLPYTGSHFSDTCATLVPNNVKFEFNGGVILPSSNGYVNADTVSCAFTVSLP